jgi:pimeloyl-ACP methyl ester carboxylesterase
VDRFEHGMVVRVAGDGGRGALLWIHGLGESGLCFEEVVGRPELEGFLHLIPDLPGYGRSPWPEEPQSLGATARHLASWLRDRERDAVTVVGHSMGGVIATLLAERDPDLVHAVVDVDGNVSLGDCTFSGRAAAEDEATFAASAFATLRDRVLANAGDDAALRGYYVSLRLADPRTFHRHSLELVALSRREELARRLRSLQGAACYIAGAPGGASPRSLELLADVGVPVTVISPTGHWPFVDRPAEFAAALIRYLEEHP